MMKLKKKSKLYKKFKDMNSKAKKFEKQLGNLEGLWYHIGGSFQDMR